MATILLWPLAAHAKRGAPRPVPAVVWDGIEYRAPLDFDHMGCVQAFDLSSGRKLWETKVYHVWMMPWVEEDNQWVFISAMQVQNGKLLVTNEGGRSYRLDLKTGRVEGYWLPWFVFASVCLGVILFVLYRKGRGIQQIPASN